MEESIQVDKASPHLEYRDQLRYLVDDAHRTQGLTRYRFCKLVGVDAGTLSNILAKRRHASIEMLTRMLGVLGYAIQFAKVENVKFLKKGEIANSTNHTDVQF